MLYQGLGPAYLEDNVRKNIMYWWIGQVTDESHWIENEEVRLHNRDASPGWGKRYRVRIFSRDSEVKIVPDSQLEMASVIAPVTGGSGHQGYGETVVLAQGSYVVGFYLDGEEGRQPIVFGTLPNNPQTRLFGGDPEDGFVPRTGFIGLTGNKKVATNDLYTSPGSHPCKEGTTADGALDDVRKHDQKTDGDIIEPRKKNIECEGGGGPIQNIQIFISKTLSIIQFLKSQTNSFLSAASDLKNNISNLVQSASSFVASMFKLIVGRMRGEVLNKINNGIKDAAALIPPNLRQVFATTANKSVDTLSCVFRKIISTLFDMGKGFLGELVDGFVVAPMCAAEKLVGDMIGNILGEVTGAIESALGAIDGVLSTVGDIASGVFDVLDIVSSILAFFQCPDPPNCKVANEWSFWNGDKEAAAVNEVLGDLLKDVAEGGDVAGCSTKHTANTSPTLSFLNDLVDGAKSTLSASPIVSATGEIMGVSITDPGSNLTSSPTVVVNANNNDGGGANIKLITSDGSTTSVDYKQGSSENPIEVVGAVVLDSGQGYLQSPDGSSNFPSNPEDIIVEDGNGKLSVAVPGTVVGGPDSAIPLGTLGINQQAFIYASRDLPPIPVYDQNSGEQISIVIPQGIETAVPISLRSTFSVPQTDIGTIDSEVANNLNNDGIGVNDYISISNIEGNSLEQPDVVLDDRPTVNGEPVDVVIQSLYIESPGLNYEPGDELVMDPSNGFESEVVFDDLGRVSDINILNPGSTFNTVPRVSIRSQTGINANIIPIFTIRPAGESQRAVEIAGDRIISVVDCVSTLLTGYINGQPYYGPWHYHKGRKMVGAKHSERSHAYIYDTPEESLKNQFYAERPTVRTQARVAVASNESPDSVSTPRSTSTPPPSSGSSGYSGY